MRGRQKASQKDAARTIPTHVGQIPRPPSTVGTAPDHPHARGATTPGQHHPEAQKPRERAPSSSRLKPQFHSARPSRNGTIVSRTGPDRFIPRALGQARGITCPVDHPHPCGDRQNDLAWSPGRREIIPVIRGKPTKDGTHPDQDRIIPAHVGEDARTESENYQAENHPQPGQAEARSGTSSHESDRPQTGGTSYGLRVDGDIHVESSPLMRGRLIIREQNSDGSSPRIRGRRPSCGSTGRRSQIIPTRVGQTLSRVRYPKQIIPADAGQALPAPATTGHPPIHPHARGPDLWATRHLHAARGISPHTRGGRQEVGSGERYIRIILTEVRQVISTSASERGSSPRTRGRQKASQEDAASTRIIPARVGHAPEKHSSSSSRANHPHARGASCCCWRSIPARDPSPRTWGRPGKSYRAIAAERSIPRHVGQTAEPPQETVMTTDHPQRAGAGEEK